MMHSADYTTPPEAPPMGWPAPAYSKSEVNRAGTILIDPKQHSGADIFWSYAVLSNWRACHGYPINTFQATLRDKLKRLGSDTAIVAQRLKRTSSIMAKLARFDRMQLARMQDIGGLRAVVKNMSEVRALQADYKKSKFKHELAQEKDYIDSPKETGYRSVHLVYRYRSETAPDYNGLSVELQIRTNLQHAWATAVETMGTFLRQALKSSQGEPEWLRFFEITGSAFAFLEKSPRVPGYENLSKEQTFDLVRSSEADLGVLDKLSRFSEAVSTITEKGQGGYHLVILDSKEKTVTVRPYSLQNLSQAEQDYAQTEARAKDGEPIEAVLVSAGPVAQLRRAYPNYFLDTDEFIRQVQRIITPSKRIPVLPGF